MSYDDWRQRNLDTPLYELLTCCGEPVAHGEACPACGYGAIWLPVEAFKLCNV